MYIYYDEDKTIIILGSFKVCSDSLDKIDIVFFDKVIWNSHYFLMNSPLKISVVVLII